MKTTESFSHLHVQPFMQPSLTHRGHSAHHGRHVSSLSRAEYGLTHNANVWGVNALLCTIYY